MRRRAARSTVMLEERLSSDKMTKLVFSLVLLSIFNAIAAKSLARIVGGDPADEGAHPYQVSLRAGGFHVCGGSVITNRWILTAAHCLVKHEGEALSVVVGSNRIMEGGAAYRICEVKVYPKYEKGGRLHDIGLAKVEGVIEFSESVQPIRLPVEDITEVNATGIFTGWGNTVLNAANIDELHVIKLKIIEWWICRQTFSSVGPTHVCTVTSEGEEGLCYGDSGSPLVSKGAQVAIASWGSPCAQGYPDVHTRVYYYVSWINSITSS